MKKHLLVLLSVYFFGVSMLSKAQNINNCMTTHGSHGHISINNLTLDTSNFTIELWVKLDTEAYNGTSPFNDPSILGNKDWGSGSNTGLEIAVYTGGVYKVNFTPNGISRTDIVSSGPAMEDRWNHIAISFDRHGFIRLYSNGILTDSIDISSGAGASIDGSFPFNLCEDGTGNYTYASFKGAVDEFRVWKGVRTTAQIEQYMCRTVPAGTPGLMVYYQMNQDTGLIVNDFSGNNHFGTLTNLTSSAWVTSGAAVGDTSAYLYGPPTWSGATVSIQSLKSGTFSVNNMSSGISGIQVYRTNYPPNTKTGITYPGTDSIYFGVYPLSETAVYQVNYNYGGYSHAVALENFISLYSRPSISAWTPLASTNTIATHTLQTSILRNYQQYVIGSFLFPGAVQIIPSDENQVIAYPNPVYNNEIYLDAKHYEDMTVNIFNMAGSIIKTISIQSWPYILDISEFPSGNYYFNFNTKNRNENIKISIAR